MIWSPRIFRFLFNKAPEIDHFLSKAHKSSIKIVYTSSLPGEFSLLKVGSFSFGSPVSGYAVNKTIFDINSTEDNINISTPMLCGSVKNTLSFGSMAASDSPKSSGNGFGE